MAQRDLSRLRDVYAAAWSERQRTGSADPEVLIRALAGSEVDVLGEPGPLRDLLVSLWERGVPPEAVEGAIRRALPGLAWTATRALARSVREIVKVFRGGSWERVDSSWQDLPEGHLKLSEVRKANDVVLRWFHQPVDKVVIGLRVDPAADSVLDRCREVPSPNRDGWAEAYCWLVPESSPDVQVMVGKAHIGWSAVSVAVWRELKAAQERRIYADGSVFLDFYGPQIELLCHLPRVG